MGMSWSWVQIVVGAVPMCPPVSPHKGASIVKFSTHNACVFGMETPLRGRSGGYAGTAPTVSFGWITRKRLMSFGWITWKNMVEMGGDGAYVPTCFALLRAHSTIF